MTAAVLRSVFAAWAVGTMALVSLPGAAQTTGSATTSKVIEIVRFKLAAGVTPAEFAALDRAVEIQHVAKQRGFVSRESAVGDNGEWLVIVRWESAEDADASMASFAEAPAAQPFMAQLDASSMTMQRFTKP